jgi:hypothetical protein
MKTHQNYGITVARFHDTSSSHEQTHEIMEQQPQAILARFISVFKNMQ